MPLRQGQREPTLAATETADGVFRVRERRAEPPRERPSGSRAMVAATLAAGLVVLLVIAALGLLGGDGSRPQAPWGPPLRSAESDAAVMQARYDDALALGRAGDYLAAREQMLAIVPFGRSEAAVRAFSVRAAQDLLAQARAALPAEPDRARALVEQAAQIAPGLDSLDAVRALADRAG